MATGANSFLLEKILLGRALSCSEANSESQKLFPFTKMEEKYGDVPYTLRNVHTAHTQIILQLHAEVFASPHIDSFVHGNMEDPDQTAWMGLCHLISLPCTHLL